MRRRTVARDLGAIPGALPRRTYVLAAGPVQEDRVTAEIRGNTFLTARNGAAVGGSFRAEISATATGSRVSGTVGARQDLRITRTGRRLGACALADGWHADRRFAGGFRSDDGRQVFDYRLSGRVAPASMSGRLRVAVRERAPKPSRCTGGNDCLVGADRLAASVRSMCHRDTPEADCANHRGPASRRSY